MLPHSPLAHIAALAAMFVLAACGMPPVSAPQAAAQAQTLPAGKLTLSQPVVLLGEVHDNAAQHALRLRAFEALLATGARPALALEQFDRQHQAAIDALLTQRPRPDADALIQVAQGARGWQWHFYRPFIDLALRHDLSIVAANVGSTEARAVMREGLAAHGFEPAVPPAVMQALTREIEASHCGMIDAPMAARMALAQVARDQHMARVLQRHAGTGVVLLAGNGHVRRSLGAPLWMDARTRARSQAIGVLEEGDLEADFDLRVWTPVQARGDPCEGMRRR